jgi:crotonobetainyl-CoA:carnitine CoA-transferase CaiB-like acyl-CoA transferase
LPDRNQTADPDRSTANPISTDIIQPGVGAYPIAGAPVEFGLFKRIPASPPPRLGGDAGQVCRELLGLSDAQIDELQQDRVIGDAQ